MFGSQFCVRFAIFFGGKYAEKYGEDKHKKVVLGLLIYYCIRARDAGAVALAEEIQMYIDELRKILIDEYAFHDVDLKEKDPEDLWNHYMSHVSNTWSFLTDIRTRVKSLHDAGRVRERATV
jgi:hypothetical protein